MKLLVVWPPLTRAAHPDPFWTDVLWRVRDLGASAHGLDLDAHVVERLCRSETLSDLVAPVGARYAMLERKGHLSPDERRRYADLVTLAPLLNHLIVRVDAARAGLRDAASYGDRAGTAPVTAIGHRAVCDLALRAVRERIGHDAWRTGAGALALETEPLERLIAPHVEAHGEAVREADALLVAVGRDDQIGFARALVRHAASGDRPACLVVPRAPGGAVSLDVPLIPLEGLDRERLVALTRGGRRAPGEVPALAIDAAPWSSAVRLWRERCLDEPAVRTTGAVAALPGGGHEAPASVVPGVPSEARRALAARLGLDCRGFEPVPVPAGAAERRLVGDDARQLTALGTRLPDPVPRPSPSPAAIPLRCASSVVVRARHDIEARGGIGVGRTAPEQIRGGLRRAGGRPLAVDLETGTLRPLSADALRVLEAIDGTRSIASILRLLGAGGDREVRERARRATAELLAAGVITI